MISDICVMPAFRGRRIAGQLLAEIERYLGRAGVTRLRITALSANSSAQAGYEHAGKWWAPRTLRRSVESKGRLRYDGEGQDRNPSISCLGNCGRARSNPSTAAGANSWTLESPANQCGPLVGLLAIIERYWATDFLQSFSYGGTATTPPPLRSSPTLGTPERGGYGRT